LDNSSKKNITLGIVAYYFEGVFVRDDIFSKDVISVTSTLLFGIEVKPPMIIG
jgi:hypothetical protein